MRHWSWYQDASIGCINCKFYCISIFHNNKNDEEKTEEQNEEEEYTSKYNLDDLELVILDDDTKNELKSVVCTDETPRQGLINL